MPLAPPGNAAVRAKGLLVAGCGAVVCALLAGCAAPVLGYDGYRHAAYQTTSAMISNLATAQLAVQVNLDGKSLLAFADDTVTFAENDANSVDSTFSSREPPDARSAALRQRMDQALSQATSALATLRITVRAGDRARMIQALAAVGKSLQAFRHLQQELQ
jgi:hypothetical protein